MRVAECPQRAAAVLPVVIPSRGVLSTTQGTNQSHSAGQRVAMLILVSEPMSASCTRQRTVFQNCIAPLPYENNEGLGCRSTGRYALLNKKKTVGRATASSHPTIGVELSRPSTSNA